MYKEVFNALTTAIANGRTDIVRSMINVYEDGLFNENGVKFACGQILNEISNSSGTPLHLATKLDHVDIVRTLLSSGANPNIQNSLGETPVDLVQSQQMTAVYVDELLKCSAKSETQRIRLLISAGVDVNGQDSPESGNNALHWAVCFGKPEAVQCLLELGASPNVINGQGATPLHEAVNRKNVYIIKILLSAGADPTIKSSKGKYMGKTPLDLAKDNSEILNILGSNFSDMESANNEKSSRNDVVDELSDSLQSLSTSSDISLKQNIAPCIPQPMHIPSFLLTPLPLITDSKLHLLWPQPQKIIQTEGQFLKLEQKFHVQIVKSNIKFLNPVIDVWNIHKEKFISYGIECSIEDIVQPESKYSGNIVCHLNPMLFTRKESYKLIIGNEQIRILASDELGLHYALCTLGQLFCLYHDDGSLPSLFIHDWPQFHHRAVLLDFSLGARKPMLETLKGYVKIMSFLKLRQLHCYFRFDHQTKNVFPYSHKDFIDISRYCNQHHVQIVPAIDVDISTKYTDIKGSICEPLHQLMSFFSSKEVHMGPNLSKIILHELQLSQNPNVIWDVLLLSSSTIIYMCCSSVQHHAELLQLVPLNCILIEYGYQVEHDYDYNVKVFTLSGFSVCVGTGTTSWGSIAGCPETAISCIHKASLAASLHGSFGLIVADWKTLPHHPAFCFSWPGIILTLGMAWNCAVHEDYLHARLPELLNFYVYEDAAQVAGYLNVELGRLEAFFHQSVYMDKQDSSLNLSSCKSSVLHQLLIEPDAVALDNFTLELIQQVIRHVKKFELELQKAKPVCFQQGEIVSELRLAMDLLLFGCRLSRVMFSTGLNPAADSCGLAVINVGISNLPPIARTDLANRLLALTEQFRAVWLSRNLPCGLQTSLCIFNTLLCKLIPESDCSLYSINGNVQSAADNSIHEVLSKSE